MEGAAVGAQVPLIDRLRDAPFALCFSGQGFEWLGTLRQAAPRGSRVRAELTETVAASRARLAPLTDELTVHRLWGFDPLTWADRPNPPAFDLATSSVSVPGIFLAQVAQFLQLREWGVDTDAAVACTGHSQGIFGVRMIEGRADASTILAIAELIGAAMPRVARAHGLIASPEGMPMQAFIGVGLAEVEEAMAQVAPEAYVGLVNSVDAVVGVGRPADLARVAQLLPQARTVALPIPVGTHHPVMEAAVRQVGRWATACGLDGRDVELATELAHHVLVRRVNWVEDTSAVHAAGARYVLDLGPGPGMAAATARNLADSDIRILSIATPRGRKELLDVPPAPPVPQVDIDVPAPVEDPESESESDAAEPTVLDEMHAVVLGEEGALASAAREILGALRRMERPRLPEDAPAPTGLEALLRAEFGENWATWLRAVAAPEKVLTLGDPDDGERRSILLTGALSCPDAVTTLCRHLADGIDVIAAVDTREGLSADDAEECLRLWHDHARDGAVLQLVEVNEASQRDMETLARIARGRGVEALVVYSGVRTHLPRTAVTGVETLLRELVPGRERRLRVRLAPEGFYTADINYGHRLLRGRWPWDVLWERAGSGLRRPPVRTGDGEKHPVLADPESAVVLVEAPFDGTGFLELEQGLARLMLGDADVVRVGDTAAGFLLARGAVALENGWPVRAVIAGGPETGVALRRCGLGREDLHVVERETADGRTPAERILTLVDMLDRGPGAALLEGHPPARRLTGGLTTSQGWCFAVAHPAVFRRAARR